MRIECPHCHVAYDVPLGDSPGGKSGAARKMKCFKCQTVFSLELDSKDMAESHRTIPPRNPRSRRVRMKILVIGIVLSALIAFVLYVASQNNWTLQPDNFGTQLVNAFASSASSADPPRAPTQDLHVTLSEGYKLRTRDNRIVLVLVGKVQNNSLQELQHIKLEGRIVDKTGKMRSQMEAPCGRIASDKRIKKLKKGSLSRIYAPRGKPFNCTIKSGYNKKFKLIFDEIPADYDDTFKLEVRPLSSESVSPLSDKHTS